VELVKLLAENSETNEALFTKFLAVEQLERSDALALAGVFADAFRKCPAGPTRIRLGDGAMHVALSAWDNQMRGNLAVLNDSAKVGPVAEAWKGVADAKNYDRFSANPMVITLACLPKYPATIKWIQDIVRLLANRNQPVTEQAVGAAVEVLRSLKPEGGPVLLDLYVTLLNLTADPEKQKSLSGSVEEEYKAKEKRSTGGGETPAAKPGGRTARPARSSGGGGRSGGGAASTSVRKPEYNFAYTAIGPNLILGISRMGTPEAFNALVQVARSRPDLLGFTAWEIYTKDKKMGMLLIRQLLVESGKNPDLKDQAKMVLARLTMASPDEVMVEAIFRAITKADPSVSEYAVEKLSQFSKEGKIPANVNLAQSMKTILQNLLTEKRTGRAVDSVLTKALEFAKTISDKELQRSVERIEGAIEKAKQPSGRKSRSR